MSEPKRRVLRKRIGRQEAGTAKKILLFSTQGIASFSLGETGKIYGFFALG